MRIGFIGSGKLGLPLIHRIVQSGKYKSFSLLYESKVGSPSHELFNQFYLYSNRQINSFIKKNDVILSVLPTSRTTLDIIQQISVDEYKKPKYWLDITSSCPYDVKNIDSLLYKKNIAYMDAPISGGPTGMQKGIVSTIMSGPKEVREKTRDIVGIYAKNTYYISENPGVASHVKLANNTLLALHLIGNAEVFHILQKNEIDISKAIQFINTSSGRNWASIQRYPDHILNEKYDYGFSFELHKKDVLTFLANENIDNSYFLRSIQRIYQDKKHHLHENMDHTEIVKIIPYK